MTLWLRQTWLVVRTVVGDGRFRRSLGVAILFAVLCAGLSWWQFARRTETAEANQQVSANWGSRPVPVAQLLPHLSSYSAATEWRPVILHGRYLPAEQRLVRNTPLNGRPGFDVLTPLLLDSGKIFVVDRGWVSVGYNHDRPDSVPAAPSGPVTVTARLQQTEPDLIGREDAPPGEIEDIDLPLLAKSLSAPSYTGAFGLIRSEHPTPTTTPIPEPQPSLDLGTDEGTHLSYAIQWIIFALIGFGALVISVRQDLRDRGDPDVLEADQRAAIRRMRRPPSDDEVEDALVDAR